MTLSKLEPRNRYPVIKVFDFQSLSGSQVSCELNHERTEEKH